MILARRALRMTPDTGMTRALMDLDALERLIGLLARCRYEVLGPTVSDGAIVYGPLEKVADLPLGWTAEQEAGHYRLRKNGDGLLFGYGVAAQSWKRFLHPPEMRLFQIERDGRDLRFEDNGEPAPRYAFLGVRPCEIAAIKVLDRVLSEDRFADPVYQSRRQSAFVAAVNCTHSAPTCFCASLGTGPGAQQGFDLLLTELASPDHHVFIAEAGTPAGAEILRELDCPEATEALRREADAAVARAASQRRRIDTAGIRDLLYDSFEHPRWDEVAGRCLTCANCTMVCPTCFCTAVEDTSEVTGARAERWRKWDSCFTQSFSYIHGGSVRMSAKSRYRQWMTHKFAAWIDQFGTSGCVGCGRCITWCPAGIDITAEVCAIREGGAPAPAAAMEAPNGDD
ncbi:MAG TPA: 4Fe-4S dicluster domain-containing protein [Bryobacteraceae bacterium]|nr:4Fe-4S dicluster domain-containing protein [Bryobacteraceae bacterium]